MSSLSLARGWQPSHTSGAPPQAQVVVTTPMADAKAKSLEV